MDREMTRFSTVTLRGNGPHRHLGPDLGIGRVTVGPQSPVKTGDLDRYEGDGRVTVATDTHPPGLGTRRG